MLSRFKIKKLDFPIFCLLVAGMLIVVIVQAWFHV